MDISDLLPSTACTVSDASASHIGRLMDIQEELLVTITGSLPPRDWRSFAAASKASKAVAVRAYDTMLSNEVGRRLLERRNVGKQFCRRWPHIVVPSGVPSIASYAFNYCEGVASITLPDSVTAIGSHAFCRCFGLASIKMPGGLTSIGAMAFWGCTGLTSIVMPAGVTTIDQSAFSTCTALTSITLPKGALSKIGTCAFEECSALATIALPEGVASIGKYAFKNCRALVSVTLPSSLTAIADGAFAGCSALDPKTRAAVTAVNPLAVQ